MSRDGMSYRFVGLFLLTLMIGISTDWMALTSVFVPTHLAGDHPWRTSGVLRVTSLNRVLLQVYRRTTPNSHNRMYQFGYQF